jgi:hypothetical protein
MAMDDDAVKKWGCAILGGLVGAAIIQSQHGLPTLNLSNLFLRPTAIP